MAVINRDASIQRANAAPRLGILGGTFDPPHYAHLALAETARVQLHLERVLFVPVGQPPHKATGPMTNACHRAALVGAAIADHPAFQLSYVDLDRPGPHYTVDMLRLVHRLHPDDELYLLMGGDSLAELHSWWNPAGIVNQARIAVMPRASSRIDVTKLEQIVPNIQERLCWLDLPSLDISSTDLRRRVSQGLPIRYLVPPPVEDYIRAQHLYVGASG